MTSAERLFAEYRRLPRLEGGWKSRRWKEFSDLYVEPDMGVIDDFGGFLLEKIEALKVINQRMTLGERVYADYEKCQTLEGGWKSKRWAEFSDVLRFAGDVDESALDFGGFLLDKIEALEASNDNPIPPEQYSPRDKTLRDEFAMAAMVAALDAVRGAMGDDWRGADLSASCYRLADAMLKARERKE